MPAIAVSQLVYNYLETQRRLLEKKFEKNGDPKNVTMDIVLREVLKLDS